MKLTVGNVELEFFHITEMANGLLPLSKAGAFRRVARIEFSFKSTMAARS